MTDESTAKEFAAAVAGTASSIREDQLGDRTPCAKFTVAELLTHLGQVLASSERAARKQPQPAEPDVSAVTPATLAEYAGRAAVAWDDAGAYEGTTEFGPGQLPAGFAAAVTLQELALHGWDLACAIGHGFAVGDEAAQVVLGAVEQIAGNARANGAYGPPVTVPADAPAFHRALAMSGRNPGWSA